MMADLILFDLDGVIRHFDPAVLARIEIDFGIEEGLLPTEAFQGPRFEAVIRGDMTRSTWVEEVGIAAGSTAAAHKWLANRGTLDPTMTAIIADLRNAGQRTAILTNGTDTINDVLRDLGIDDLVERTFCSAFIGNAKPEAAAFIHVCEAMSVHPTSVIFFDDTELNVEGARQLGITAYFFNGPDVVTSALGL